MTNFAVGDTLYASRGEDFHVTKVFDTFGAMDKHKEELTLELKSP